MSCTSVSCRYVLCDILGVGVCETEFFFDFRLRLNTLNRNCNYKIDVSKRDVYWQISPSNMGKTKSLTYKQVQVGVIEFDLNFTSRSFWS